MPTSAAPFSVSALAALGVSLGLVSCGPAANEVEAGPDAAGSVGTAEQRLALADTLIARALRRDAFSEFKNDGLRLDPRAAMEAAKPDFAAAETQEALFYAITRLSHARRDTHLSVALVDGGLQVRDSAGLEHADGRELLAPEAPVRVLPDYGPAEGWFVADTAAGTGLALPPPGARVTHLNGRAVDEWAAAARPWIRSSSEANLRWRLAQRMTQASALLPPELRSAVLELTVDTDSGPSAFTLQYRPPDELRWAGHSEPSYPGFTEVLKTPTYDLHRADDGTPWVVLTWYGFRETMVEDVDALVEYADAEGLLDHALVVDATRSRGGSRGPYAVQRLTPLPFRTTFGNLRLSDVVPLFIEEKRDEFERQALLDGSVPETVDDGTWLMDWLDTDVQAGLDRGDAYSNDVPFKLAHAPRSSDGVLQPAPVHFRGPLVVLSGPRRGSHLDQFVAIVADNGLGGFIGMQPGGYSNTWEWEETVVLPGSDRPLVQFMYNIGHTIRPNGEVLEGNPAMPDVEVPLTREHALDYYSVLLDAAHAWLTESGYAWSRPD